MPDYSGEAGGHLVLPPPFRLYFHRVDFGFQPASLYQYAPQVLGLEGSLVIGANGFGGFLQLPSGQPLQWNGDTGISRDAANTLDFGNGTQGDKTATLNFATANLTTAALASAGVVKFSTDAGISRDAAGVIDIGNGNQGDKSGTLKLAILNVGGDVGLSRSSLGTMALGNGSQGDATGNLLLNRIVQYFGVLTAGIGTAPIYSIVTSTAQTASIGSTTLYAVPSSGAGLYRVSYSLVTTSAGTGGTAGLTINWNNGSASASSGSGTIALQTLGSEVTTTLLLESGASQNITYSTTVSGATGSPQYSLRIRLEYLG